MRRGWKSGRQGKREGGRGMNMMFECVRTTCRGPAEVSMGMRNRCWKRNQGGKCVDGGFREDLHFIKASLKPRLY